MNKERLLKMADFLEALPPHKFDFESYLHLGTKSPENALAAPTEHCGTTACAVGWMPGIFPETFDFKNFYEKFGDKGQYVYVDEANVRDFLDITPNQYGFLFLPNDSELDNYASAHDVAAQIRDFVATDGQNADDFFNNKEDIYND